VLAYGAHALAGCAHPSRSAVAVVKSDVAKPLAREDTTAKIPDVRAQRNGRAFPKGVLALTWDDGPDLRTLALAEFLKRERVSATFFVVNEWSKALSSDPGFGPHVYETGHAKLPLLADLVALGHRVGNHTAHHALLGKLSDARVDEELADAERAIDPALRDELRLFRVPGGDWTASASRAVDSDPYLADLVGPIRWDVDAKDWEGAVWCESNKPSLECEHADGRYRVRASVMAHRYEEAIESAGRGIVLMHDRVGDVGGDYAVELAERVVPWLRARGYVFAAPVLEFGALRPRLAVEKCGGLQLGDVDGDGRADACVRDGDRVACAPSTSRDDGGLTRVAFDETATRGLTLPEGARSFELADIDGDGRADVCARTGRGIECARSLASGKLSAFALFGALPRSSNGEIHFGDIDGDGRADVCGLAPGGAWCARSSGTAFESPRSWLFATPPLGTTDAMSLGDLNGDGRADLCLRTKDGIDCAVSTGATFSHFTRWSSDTFSGDATLSLADLNGDGRADVCGKTKDGVACAFSNGRTFTRSTTWLAGGASAEWGRIGDVNGDGRSDFCDCDASGVRCALAP
jgi:peptidoglycan/xylan/chitin deacetylase (PgdA/CDA1 family)